MARIDKKKQKRQAQEAKRKLRQYVFYNGGGTLAHKIKCENCGRTMAGDERMPGNCPVCGGETALYDPQLR